MPERFSAMNEKTQAWLRALFLLAAALLALPALAVAEETVLGNHGELYLVKTGLYGELFPNGKETDAGNNVLALEITRPGEPAARVLVPETKDKALESSPAVIFEADSGTVFLVWDSRLSATQSSLKLASFDGDHWAPAIEVTTDSYSTKTSLQLAT